MQCSTFLRTHDVIAHVHSDGVTPISFDQRSRECSVDKKSALIHSIGSNRASGDVEVVRGASACKEGQYESDMVRSDKTYRRQGLRCRD